MPSHRLFVTTRGTFLGGSMCLKVQLIYNHISTWHRKEVLCINKNRYWTTRVQFECNSEVTFRNKLFIAILVGIFLSLLYLEGERQFPASPYLRLWRNSIAQWQYDSGDAECIPLKVQRSLLSCLIKYETNSLDLWILFFSFYYVLVTKLLWE